MLSKTSFNLRGIKKLVEKYSLDLFFKAILRLPKTSRIEIYSHQDSDGLCSGIALEYLLKVHSFLDTSLYFVSASFTLDISSTKIYFLLDLSKQVEQENVFVLDHHRSNKTIPSNKKRIIKEDKLSCSFLLILLIVYLDFFPPFLDLLFLGVFSDGSLFTKRKKLTSRIKQIFSKTKFFEYVPLEYSYCDIPIGQLFKKVLKEKKLTRFFFLYWQDLGKKFKKLLFKTCKERFIKAPTYFFEHRFFSISKLSFYLGILGKINPSKQELYLFFYKRCFCKASLKIHYLKQKYAQEIRNLNRSLIKKKNLLLYSLKYLPKEYTGSFCAFILSRLKEKDHILVFKKGEDVVKCSLRVTKDSRALSSLFKKYAFSFGHHNLIYGGTINIALFYKFIVNLVDVV